MTENGYPKPAGSPDFPALELDVLDYWAADDTFRASIERRDGAEEYVFYDGPPFANGLPHYGHLLTGYVKDIVPRYRTMRGYKVERRFGWDTHGLPAELEVQRQLDASESEMTGQALWHLFTTTYLAPGAAAPEAAAQEGAGDGASTAAIVYHGHHVQADGRGINLLIDT